MYSSPQQYNNNGTNNRRTHQQRMLIESPYRVMPLYHRNNKKNYEKYRMTRCYCIVIGSLLMILMAFHYQMSTRYIMKEDNANTIQKDFIKQQQLFFKSSSKLSTTTNEVILRKTMEENTNMNDIMNVVHHNKNDEQNDNTKQKIESTHEKKNDLPVADVVTERKYHRNSDITTNMNNNNIVFHDNSSQLDSKLLLSNDNNTINDSIQFNTSNEQNNKIANNNKMTTESSSIIIRNDSNINNNIQQRDHPQYAGVLDEYNNNKSGYIANVTNLPLEAVSLVEPSIVGLLSSNNNNMKTTNTIIIPTDLAHTGATDEYNNNPGYVANVTHLREWMKKRYCTNIMSNNNNNNNNEILSCRIPFVNDEEMNQVCNVDVVTNIIHVPKVSSMINNPKILCAVYTFEENDHNIRGIAETWGWKCDGFFASSTKTKKRHNMTLFEEQKEEQEERDDDEVMTITNHSSTSKSDPRYIPPPTEMLHILHNGPEIYNNMWQKTRSTLSYIYDHYLNDFDYFYLCGDDTHLIVENLKSFLIQYMDKTNTNIIRRNHLGEIIKQPDHVFFTGMISKVGRKVNMMGGGGYVISRLALKRFVEEAIPNCSPFAESAKEDRYVSECFTNYLNISLIDAADEEGRQRFHVFGPNAYMTGRATWGFYADTARYWATIHGNKANQDLISPSSISFHNMKSVFTMKRHHIALYYTASNSHYQWSESFPNETGACPIGTQLQRALNTIQPLTASNATFDESDNNVNDTSTSLLNHPHAGATDEFGNNGYVANVTYLREWMKQRYCTVESNDNANVLSCKIKFANQNEMEQICNADISQNKPSWNVMSNILKVPNQHSMLLIDENAPKILCAVYTYDKKDHSMRGIAETWGWRCDGFFAASTKTTRQHNMTSYEIMTNSTIDPSYVPPPTEMLNLLHQGPESYDNMWQKTRSMLSYMYDHYLNDFDYFYLCGDDTHLIVENLKHFLMQYMKNSSVIHKNHLGQVLSEPDPVFFTGSIALRGRRVYMVGGGGYVISRPALKLFVEKGLPYCFADSASSKEDRYLSDCFMEYLNVTLLDATDEDGKQRIHVAAPHWYPTGRATTGTWGDTANYWARIHGNKTNEECVSPSTIAFHHMRSVNLMKLHHITLYYNPSNSHYLGDEKLYPFETGSCPVGTKVHTAFATLKKSLLKPTRSPIRNSPIPMMDKVHAGATDEYGNLGYVANVTNMRQWMKQRYCTEASTSCKIPFANDEEMNQICSVDVTKGDIQLGWNIMTNIVNVPKHDSVVDNNSPKILCAVYTFEENDHNIRGIAETWGWKCDGFFASSNKTTKGHYMTIFTKEMVNHSPIDSTYIPPPTEMLHIIQNGPEVYNNMWQKTRSTLSYIYDHYLNDFDYFYLCGDDTHLIVENLKSFLIQYMNNTTIIRRNHMGDIISQPDNIFFTGMVAKHGRKVYMAGGGGYVISRLALKRFVEEAIPNCSPLDESVKEDQYVSDCFNSYLNISLIDAADENGKQRFHGFAPHAYTTGRAIRGFWADTARYWATIHGNKTNEELISPSTISFHNMKSVISMKLHHIILYYNSKMSHYQTDTQETGACPVGTPLQIALSQRESSQS